MKSVISSILFVLTAILVIQCEKDEPQVNISDNNFLKALIESGIDTDGDGKISYAEAEVVISLDVSGDSISDMAGIDKFVNLETLICNHNQLTALDITNNTALKYLECSNNQLIALNVSNNTALTWLNCNLNKITTLYIANNTALDTLMCFDNQLTILDVSNQPDLKILIGGGNQLTSLDLSNNSSIGQDLGYDAGWFNCYLEIRNMPSLEEVCVWTMPFPPEGFKLCANNSPNVYYTTDCSK